MKSVLRASLAMLATLAGAAQAQHGHGAPSAAPPPPARIDITADARLLEGLARHDVALQVHGTALRCSGVDLVDVLRREGAMPDGPLRGVHLARRVEAAARDGYRVAFSLGELDPTLGHRRVYVVDRCNGAALDERDGPLRLAVPQDERPARSARQLQSLTVL